MFPVYNARSLLKNSPLEGGATYPLLIEVFETSTPIVMKNFKKSNMKQFNAVVYEVLSSILAREFDLLVPDPCLVKIDKKKFEGQSRIIDAKLKDSDGRLKFGCNYISPNYPYSDVLTNRYLSNCDIETIYAFDCLILNGDRRSGKPNMIFTKNRSIALIDHEKTFYGNELRFNTIKEGRLSCDFKNHVFYPRLKVAQGRPAPDLETFRLYLSRINLNDFKTCYQQLLENGHEADNFDAIMDYLCYAKDNSDKYTDLIRATLLK